MRPPLARITRRSCRGLQPAIRTSLLPIEQKEVAFGASKGCSSPRTLLSDWPLGLDLIVSAFQAAKQGRILQYFDALVSRTGHTFEQRLLGVSGIDTIDPDNIEAILSTQFKGT